MIVHVTVKLTIADSAYYADVVEDCEYKFTHEDIVDYEIIESEPVEG